MSVTLCEVSDQSLASYYAVLQYSDAHRTYRDDTEIISFRGEREKYLSLVQSQYASQLPLQLTISDTAVFGAMTTVLKFIAMTIVYSRIRGRSGHALVAELSITSLPQRPTATASPWSPRGIITLACLCNVMFIAIFLLVHFLGNVETLRGANFA